MNVPGSSWAPIEPRDDEEPQIDPLTAVILLAWIALFGSVGWRLAGERNRYQPVWFALAAILGPAALMLLQAAPPGRCRSCLTPTRGWITRCAWCNEDVRLVPFRTQQLLTKIRATEANTRAARGRLPAVMSWLAGLPTRVQVHRQASDASPTPNAARPSGFGRPSTPALAGNEPTFRIFALGQGHDPLPTRDQTVGSGRVEGPLATATFMAGSHRLEPGRHYSFWFTQARLQLRGPVEVDPTRLALQLDLRTVEATYIAGRLLIYNPRVRSAQILAFLSIAGTTPNELVGAILEASQAAASA